MRLSEMSIQAYRIAKEHGWVDEANPVPIPEQVALLHSEVSEAFESWRNGEPISWTNKEGKPEGIGAEFADILIRIGHYAVANHIDLEFEVKRKMAYNITRPYRHGGKQA